MLAKTHPGQTRTVDPGFEEPGEVPIRLVRRDIFARHTAKLIVGNRSGVKPLEYFVFESSKSVFPQALLKHMDDPGSLFVCDGPPRKCRGAVNETETEIEGPGGLDRASLLFRG